MNFFKGLFIVLGFELFLVLACFAIYAHAGGLSQGFMWTAPDSDIGTKIYIGTESGNYTNSEDAGYGTGTYQLDNLTCETTYFVAATHYKEGLESDLCDEIFFMTDACMTVTFYPLPEIPEPSVIQIPLLQLN